MPQYNARDKETQENVWREKSQEFEVKKKDNALSQWKVRGAGLSNCLYTSPWVNRKYYQGVRANPNWSKQRDIKLPDVPFSANPGTFMWNLARDQEWRSIKVSTYSVIQFRDGGNAAYLHVISR